MAYASALGKLGAVEATDALLALLVRCEDEMTRLEVALALARLVGDERHFIRLLRQLRAEPGTGAAQAVTGLSRHLVGEGSISAEAQAALLLSAEAFAQNRMDVGSEQLLAGIEALPPLAETGAESIRRVCAAHLAAAHLVAAHLATSPEPPLDYLLLLLFVLRAG